MRIARHRLEPWLIEYQNVRYNLAQSGVTDRTLRDVVDGESRSLDRLQDTVLRDNDPRGSLELRSAIASLYDGVKPHQVLVTTGSSEALFLYFHVRFERGANVVVPVPAFQSLYEVPRYLGYEVRTLPLEIHARFRPDLSRLASLVDDRTRAIVLNTPHNPTGMVFSAEELTTIAEIAERHGADLLADEHYRFLPYDTSDLLPSLYGRDAAVVATGSMIKCLGCVGLRVGWIVGSPGLLSACQTLKDYTTHTIPPLTDQVAQAALARRTPVVAMYRSWIGANLDEFRTFVAAHDDLIHWVEPQAGVVGFPHFVDTSTDSTLFARRLAERHGVFVMPGEVFERTGCFRVSFGVPPHDFRAAMERISSCIEARSWLPREVEA